MATQLERQARKNLRFIEKQKKNTPFPLEPRIDKKRMAPSANSRPNRKRGTA